MIVSRKPLLAGAVAGSLVTLALAAAPGANASPPSWAPAHGYRSHEKEERGEDPHWSHHEDREEREHRDYHPDWRDRARHVDWRQRTAAPAPPSRPAPELLKLPRGGDLDHDHIPNYRDTDVDGDGVPNRADRFPTDRRRR